MSCDTKNTGHWINVVLMLGHRRRRGSNIKTTLVQCIVFAGRSIVSLHCAATAVKKRDVAQWLERGALQLAMPAVQVQPSLGAGFSDI